MSRTVSTSHLAQVHKAKFHDHGCSLSEDNTGIISADVPAKFFLKNSRGKLVFLAHTWHGHFVHRFVKVYCSVDVVVWNPCWADL